ncbi:MULTISPECIES: 50S ribosomal protein L7/L12 [Pirellulaceae]|uniref:Large ribosomal subunit protein bL12 n=1 Tax=Aporhodopirellula rubra TaxID=980271 RepID=A0A7W5DZA5_9BACT|nr:MULTISPECIES: 50S ribosomal protein L7/L12 [Pirellulaceae]EMI42862.1 50S ribosomal protein L7/L12 [Rhodopirellula sp. SWK7]MBB3206848.1 large subunit ribosomal protein L7/L12 [Aporhodopirellula rubra]
MSEEATAVAEYSAEAKELGDKIANMTLKQAKELSDYLKDEHGIEPASGGGAVMVAAGDGGGAAAAVEQTEFDVVLTSFGDKKLNVVKVVKNITGASLMEAKKMVEGVPATLKEGVSKEDAEKVKAEVEEAGGSVELK